jgi:integrase/recombinase XerD
MKVSLVIREGAGKNRRYVKVNKKVYPDGTVFCLRYKRKFETLNADNLTAALAARAIKEAALLTGQGSTASAQAKRIGIDDAIAVYLSNIAVTKKHKTWLAYSRATSEFRESCTKQFLDEITKDDLTAFVIAQKKKVSDRTIDNRLADLGTFLHANNIPLSLHHAFTKKKVKAYVLEELRALNAASTDDELQVWHFFLGTGFREDETAHACYTDIDFTGKKISVLMKPEFNWEPKDKEERTLPIPDSLIELLKVRKAMNPDNC